MAFARRGILSGERAWQNNERPTRFASISTCATSGTSAPHSVLSCIYVSPPYACSRRQTDFREKLPFELRVLDLLWLDFSFRN